MLAYRMCERERHQDSKMSNSVEEQEKEEEEKYWQAETDRVNADSCERTLWMVRYK